MDFPKDITDVSRRFASEREIVGTTEVLVGTDFVVLDQFVSDVHDKLSHAWSDRHVGATLPISVDELKRYFITGIKSRIIHVRGKEYNEIRTNERWYMPAPMARVIAQLGVVESEAPVMRIIPRLSEDLDALSLSHSEWLRLGYRLKRLEDDPDTRFNFAHALEKEKSGDPKLMGLLPRRNEQGEIIELRSFNEVDPIAATAYFIFGMNPLEWDSVVLPSHPFLQPAFYQPAQIVSTMLLAMSEVQSSAR